MITMRKLTTWFRRTPAGDTRLDTRSALSTSEAVSWWQDWLLFLQQQQALRELRATAGQQDSTSVTYADSLAARQETIQTTLTSIPAVRRQVFTAVLNRTRQQVEREAEAATPSTLPDPDAVEGITLELLLREAQGTDSDGLGVVYLSSDPGVRPIEVDTQLLASLPTRAQYQALRPQRVGGGQIVLAWVLTLVMLGWLGWWFGLRERGGTATAVTSAPPVQVNGQAVTGWTPGMLTFTQPDGTTATLSVVPTDQPTPDAPYAVWQTASSWPLALCTSAALDGVQTLTLSGSGDTPTRHYTRQPEAASPDLLLATCGGRDAPVPFVLADLTPVRSHPVGEPVSVAGQALSVLSMTLTADGSPAAADEAGQATLTVSVSAPLEWDWTALTPVLRLPSGETLAGERTGTTFRYLVSLPAGPLEVGWEITDPTSGQLVRWRTTLEPPADRQVLVRQQLTVTDAQAEALPGGGVRLRVVLVNGGNQALTLTPADVTITVGEARLEVPALSALQTPLAGGERRPLDLTLPDVPDGATVVVQIGGMQVQLAP
jgi:hypothetical protein